VRELRAVWIVVAAAAVAVADTGWRVGRVVRTVPGP
jgi:hypothetical protein